MTGADGTRGGVVSDATWQVGRGPIIHNSLQEGETYDARLEVPGWDAPGFDASRWSAACQVEPPGGALFSQLMPPMKVVETRRPERLTAPRPDTYLCDFGQLFGGWIRIRLRGPAGTRAGEQLRESVVQPAQRSPAAHRKATSKRTDDGLPVHSFRGLMSELGTLTANRVRMVDSGATFTMHSEPTALQQRCFDLLGISAQV